MGIREKLQNIKGNPFEKLNKEEINEEKIRLEREEKLKQQEVDKLSRQKKELFDKGFNVTKTEQRSLARKIKQLDRKIKMHTDHLDKLSKNIMVCDNLQFIQENQEMLNKFGLISKINSLPKSKLDEWLASVNVSDQVSRGNVEKMLSTMDAEYGLMGEPEEDSETKELMDIWSSSDVDAEEAFEQWEKKKSEEDEDLETV